MKLFVFLVFSFAILLSCKDSTEDKMPKTNTKTPIIIAHRGAQSIYPEHTIEGYQKAIELGADFIEPDLVMTKDGILISRHEPYISGSTDITDHPEFADRKTKKIIDENEITDWFVSDFTLAEIKTLRAKQAWKERSRKYDGLYTIPTFQEIMDLAKVHKTTSGNPIGIYPELKHPTYHKEIGLPMLDIFMEQIEKSGFNRKEAPIFVQCFEVSTLQEIRKKSSVRLVQLMGASGISEAGELLFTMKDGSYESGGSPYDFRESGNNKSYQWFATDEGMQFVATYANALGPWKAFVVPYKIDPSGKTNLLPVTNFVTLAHKNGLEVHPYTFRDEDTQWQTDGNIEGEYRLFRKTGIDGLFTDNTEAAIKALRN